MTTELTVNLNNVTIGKKISSGFQCSIHEGKFMDRKVVVKIIKSNQNTDLNELINLKKFQGHVGIVAFLGSFVDSVWTHIVMECYKGDLNKTILTKAEARKAAEQLISAVSYIHENGYIHRDITPDSCLYDINHNIKLTSFKFAVEMNKDGTYTGECCGTSGYISLEVETDNLHSAESDVFSIGATIYKFYTNTHLFIVSESEPVSEIVKNVRHGIRVIHPLTGLRSQFQELQTDNCGFVRIPGTEKYKRIKTSKRLEELGAMGLLINRMVSISRQSRPTCQQILQIMKNEDFDELVVPTANGCTDMDIDDRSIISETLDGDETNEIILLKEQLLLETFKNEKYKTLIADLKNQLRLKNIEIEKWKKSFLIMSGDKEEISGSSKQLKNQCIICDKIFANKYILQRHEKVHETSRIHCELSTCKQTFTRDDAMKAHFIRKHTRTKILSKFEKAIAENPPTSE